MWFFWYFLLVFALFGCTLPVIWIASKLNSKIHSGNYHAAVLKASLVTVTALTIWVCLLLQPFNLANVEHYWWRYLTALFMIVPTVAEWHKARQLRPQKHVGQNSDDVKIAVI